jgi:hypothetical protein
LHLDPRGDARVARLNTSAFFDALQRSAEQSAGGDDIEMKAMAIAFLLVIGMAVTVATALVTWGLVLEARSNREWRRQGLHR